jgi:hypothetical protein
VVVVLVAHIHFDSSPVRLVVADDSVPGDMLCIGMGACPVARVIGVTKNARNDFRIRPR